jgi:fumarate reductase subunit D
MSALNSFGALVSGIIAAIVMLVFAILSLFVTVFIVDAAANIGGLDPADGFVVLGASIIAAAAIMAGGGLSMPEGEG